MLKLQLSGIYRLQQQLKGIAMLFQIDVVIRLDSDLLALVKEHIDQQSDRKAAASLAADVRAKTDALKAVLPSQP